MNHRHHKIRILAALGILIAPVLFFEAGCSRSEPAIERNRLRSGQAAAELGPVHLEVSGPIDFKGQSKAQILLLRQQMVGKYPQLLEAPYKPFPPTFAEIGDGLPWVGIWGQYFYGKGEKSTKGLSAASRQLLNPFLLVEAEFWGLTIWNERGRFKWRADVTEAQLVDGLSSLYAPPREVIFSPKEARLEMTYYVSHQLRSLNNFLETPLEVEDIMFGLLAMNARDLGFNYIYVDLPKSENVSNPTPVAAPMVIGDVFGQSKVCGLKAACNHYIPSLPVFDHLEVKTLPARAQIKLWQNQPKKALDQADFLVVLTFK